MEAETISRTPPTVQHDDRNPIFAAATGFGLFTVGTTVFGNASFYANRIAARIAQAIHLRNLREWQASAARSGFQVKLHKRRSVRSSN